MWLRNTLHPILDCRELNKHLRKYSLRILTLGSLWCRTCICFTCFARCVFTVPPFFPIVLCSFCYRMRMKGSCHPLSVQLFLNGTYPLWSCLFLFWWQSPDSLGCSTRVVFGSSSVVHSFLLRSHVHLCHTHSHLKVEQNTHAKLEFKNIFTVSTV